MVGVAEKEARVERKDDLLVPIPPTRELVNSSAFGSNTTLMDYDDRMEIRGNGQTLSYIFGFSRENLSLQTDGTYRSERTPLLAGWVGLRNQDGTGTLRDKQGTVRTFNSQGFLTAITDRTGNTVTIVRNGAQIQQILEPGGRALTFQYSGGGISQITDPLGRTVTYTYEGVPVPYVFPRLRSVTNPAGGTTTYTYAPTFKPYDIESITDARGITYLTNTYCSTSGGNTCPLDPAVVTQTAADGGITRFDYVVTNRAVTQATVTDPRGHQSVHRFNSRGHEVVTVDGSRKGDRLLFWGFAGPPAWAQRGVKAQGGCDRGLPGRGSERLLSIHAGAQGGEVMIDERLGAGKSSLVPLSLNAPGISEAVPAMMLLV